MLDLGSSENKVYRTGAEAAGSSAIASQKPRERGQTAAEVGGPLWKSKIFN